MQKKISCHTLNIGKYIELYRVWSQKHLRWTKSNSAKMKNKKFYRCIDPPIRFLRSSRTSFSAIDTVLFLRSAK